ncbi:uracil-DNA glycosylase [Comamonadaceae bacterium OH2545_COT-014]|nr:uracil-DNA glycosylase [Comamonadaceae bacterium OH2545_COT-014]
MTSDAGCLQAWPPADLAGLPAGWQAPVRAFLASAEGRRLDAALQAELATDARIYPPEPLRALRLTLPDSVRVVILGQDPYHGPGQANGLAFDVAAGVRPPPSLRNIFHELARDLGRPPIQTAGLLAHWARQGVLLLNTSLTVRAGAPASHARLGWGALTDALIRQLATGPQARVFMLWGAHAQAKAAWVTEADVPHLVLCANHPSPLSARRPPAPFIGCGHFSQANAFLCKRGEPAIDWLGAGLA